MKTFMSSKYKYILVEKKMILLDDTDCVIKVLLLPKREKVISFHGIYEYENKIKVVFYTNDNYLYKATFNEDTFEFSDWGLTK